MKLRNYLFVAVLCAGISCDNLLFPQTGKPMKGDDPRKTPAGVITQLFNSYESRSIGIFTSVLAADFKFYISASFDRTQMVFSGDLQSEMPDTFMHYVNTTSLYYYWDYKAEVNSTTKLFSNAEDITIGEHSISRTNYTIDSNGDTAYAEVEIADVTFNVSRYEGINTLVTYQIINQPQVFLMKKDADDLWVIWKWYDLGTETGS